MPVLPSRHPCAALLAAAGTLAAADPAASPSAALPDPRVPAAPALHSWELPPLTVTADRAAPRDADLVGAYGQPRWSAIRQWSEVRSYVIPAGQFEFEYWLSVKQPTRREREQAKDAGEEAPDNGIRQMFEAEMGLGHRLQLDLYLVYEKEGNAGVNALDATKVELRYALADWDRIWGNPTLYAEWEQAADGPDSIECKLLTSGTITDRLHWGNNLVWEGKMGDDRETGHEFNTAIAYSLVDGTLSVGAEESLAYVRAKRVDDATGAVDDGHDHHWELACGPSLRWYPTPPMHVILTTLVGLTPDSHQTATTLIAGWEF